MFRLCRYGGSSSQSPENNTSSYTQSHGSRQSTFFIWTSI